MAEWHLTSRSIPASAGEPLRGHYTVCIVGVYPRECGGTTDSSAPPYKPGGLSPRVRGNPLASDGRFFVSGSIPASAGEPLRLLRSICRLGVYPRECGGTVQLPFMPTSHYGLSPRVRGNLFLSMPGQELPRSIPASAGEPLRGVGTCTARKVYPRECGGTLCGCCCYEFGGGLSPRVRGNRWLSDCYYGRRGSIPASAGEP